GGGGVAMTTVHIARPWTGTKHSGGRRSIGARAPMLMLRHILPGTLPSVIVYCSLRVGTSILTAAALSFIGLGAPPPSPEWGAMLAEGRSYLGVADQITLFPGLAIFVTVLAFNLLGDGLRDALDQKLRQQSPEWDFDGYRCEASPYPTRAWPSPDDG